MGPRGLRQKMATAVRRLWRPVSSSALVGLPPVRSFATSLDSLNFTAESRKKEEMKPIVSDVLTLLYMIMLMHITVLCIYMYRVYVVSL